MITIIILTILLLANVLFIRDDNKNKDFNVFSAGFISCALFEKILDIILNS